MDKKFKTWLKTGDVARKLKSLYQNRPYHNWNHIENCLSFFDHQLKQHSTDELLFAVVYHDAIYNPNSKTNEEDSVSVAKLDLAGEGLDLNKIERLILATKHEFNKKFHDDETQCMVDVDLSILGSDTDDYIDYTNKIREEYNHVDDLSFSKGRIDFLKRLLSKSAIFYKLTHLESKARKNIYEEIMRLSR